MSKYRLLHEGDTVQEDDEYLWPDAQTWAKVEVSIGFTYGLFGLTTPMRRPIEGDPAPEQKTINVRIAVAVDLETLEWNAEGFKIKGAEPRGENIINHVAVDLGNKVQYFWVEAVIPITEPPVIVGNVTEGE